MCWERCKQMDLVFGIDSQGRFVEVEGGCVFVGVEGGVGRELHTSECGFWDWQSFLVVWEWRQEALK